VNVTNGNFNGQYAGNFDTSSDILMDQAVPVERLGNEFALVKGNGSLTSNMEGALVIATENNTEIRVNNETLPIATLNIGEYFMIPGSKYQLQGNEHYNLYIRTSKMLTYIRFLQEPTIQETRLPQEGLTLFLL